MYSLVYVTAKDMGEAKKISTALLEKRLIACSNMFQTKSLYVWEGSVCSGPEVSIIMKTKTELVEKVNEVTKEVHSYDVPCVLAFKIDKANKAFLDWIGETTSQ